MTNRSDPGAVPTLGDRLRADRRRDLRETAREVIADVGVSALTMQRVADYMGCSIGSVYRYYPSKVALLARLRIDANDRLACLLALALSNLDRLLADRGVDDAATRGLVRVVAAVRFWIEAEDDYPDDVELSRQMLCHPADRVDNPDDVRPPLADVGVLALVGVLLDEAMESGSLVQGDSYERAVMMIAGTAGVLMASSAHREIGGGFDDRCIAVGLTRDLLRIWGAQSVLLERSERLVDDLAALGQLVPSPGAVK